MIPLSEIREQLDEIDSQIVRLYEKRMELCTEVGLTKIASGKKVYDKEREMQKLATLSQMASNEFNQRGITELYEQLMAMSRKLQYQILTEHGVIGKTAFIGIDSLDKKGARLVFQGVEGAYSQAALHSYFGEECDSFHVQTFRDAMETLEDGLADYAVLPIENSSAGAVSQVYDLLVEFENHIVGEIVLPIRHMLAGLPGTKIEEIECVYSHPQKTQAAVCSEYAAKIHHLEILKEGINDNSNNSTRFIIVSNQKVYLKQAGKISICFEIPHESGSLYHILSHFIYNNLNMTKIESRPIEGRTWEYRFFVDFEGNLNDAAVKNAIRGIREEARNLKILGNY